MRLPHEPACVRDTINVRTDRMITERALKHGTRTGYVRGCRCQPCKTANTVYQNEWSMAQRRAQGIGPRPVAQHGTPSKYARGCRCQPCREAHRVWDKARRQKRRELIRRDSTLAAHGSASTYRNWGCRCEPCTRANYATWLRWRASDRGRTHA